jgi:hypothetical protein
LRGRDVIVVKVKASPLTMSLMGQTLFSIDLVARFEPDSISAVALCTDDDAVLRPLLERDPRCRVVVLPEFGRPVQQRAPEQLGHWLR